MGNCCGRGVRLLAEDFIHGLAFGKFVDEFVEVADLFLEGVLDILNAVAADHAGDFGRVGVELGGFGEEGFEVYFSVDDRLQGLVVVAGEPLDDSVEFGLGAALPFHLGDVVRVDAGEGHFVDAGVVHDEESVWKALWHE